MWRRIQKLFAALLPALLLLVFIVVVSSMLNRWDDLVAVTLIPLWAWAGVGMALSLLSWLAFRGVPSLAVFCLWLGTGIAFSEETHSLVRELAKTIDPGPARDASLRYRVLNVNAIGTREGLEQVKQLEPDLVIIQAPPKEEELKAIVETWFEGPFDFFTDGRQAIAGRGAILDSIADDTSEAVHARVQLEDGFLVDVTSVELEPCLPSPALWRPQTWEDLHEARVRNRRTLRSQLGENQIPGNRIGRIVSGGFHTPPGDDVFRPLESNGMIDTFREAGLGWGNTYPSDYAVLRIDQIWVSNSFEIISTLAIQNRNSDHRIVIADLELPKE